MREEESQQTIIARIDERTKNINDKLTIHMMSFEEHKKDDNDKFDFINKTIWMVSGGACVVMFVLNWFHK